MIFLYDTFFVYTWNTIIRPNPEVALVERKFFLLQLYPSCLAPETEHALLASTVYPPGYTISLLCPYPPALGNAMSTICYDGVVLAEEQKKVDGDLKHLFQSGDIGPVWTGDSAVAMVVDEALIMDEAQTVYEAKKN